MFNSSLNNAATIWGVIPDYSAGISLEITTTNKPIPFTGVLIGEQNIWGNGGERLFINDVTAFSSKVSLNSAAGVSSYVFVNKNDEYRVVTPSRWTSITLYPLKGVVNA